MAKIRDGAANGRGDDPRSLGLRSDGGPTLVDVARLAGVSPITVSRTLNTPNIVSEKTRTAVKAAVEQLGYVTNALAGSLQTRRSRLVAAIVPTIATSMFAETIEAFSERLRRGGYEVLLGLTGFDGERAREEELVAAVLSRRPDAIFLTGVEHTERTRQLLTRAAIPVVESWDLTSTPLDMTVGFSHEAVGRAAAEHLVERGCRRLAVVAAGDDRARKRRDGFVARLRESGLETVVMREVASPGTMAAGREALAAWATQGLAIDGVFCSSDPIAQGVHTEARARGLDLPGDLALIGFGDFAFAALMEPPLSTIRLDSRNLGVSAAEAILSEIDGVRSERRVIDIGFDLIRRSSSQGSDRDS